jgi:hypothetical protein
MNIAIIAAQGRSGRIFVERALKAGHLVRAGIHGNNPFNQNQNLTTVQCDATKPADLRTLFQGVDVVVSLLGHVKGSAPDVQTVAITQVVSAMKELGLRRVVSLTGTGVRFPGDKITLIDRFLNFGVGIIDPSRVHDGSIHVDVLKKSNLDWTVIRVLKLENVTPKLFKLSENGPTKIVTCREEVAAAILEVLSNTSYIQQAPIISPV